MRVLLVAALLNAPLASLAQNRAVAPAETGGLPSAPLAVPQELQPLVLEQASWLSIPGGLEAISKLAAGPEASPEARSARVVLELARRRTQADRRESEARRDAGPRRGRNIEKLVRERRRRIGFLGGWIEEGGEPKEAIGFISQPRSELPDGKKRIQGFGPRLEEAPEPKHAPESRTILVTGFEPFDDLAQNVSGALAAALDGRRIEIAGTRGERELYLSPGAPPAGRPLLAGYSIVGKVLPVSFDRAAAEIARLLEEIRPAGALLLGLSGWTPSLELEELAKNVVHSPDFADADGRAPELETVDDDGPPALRSNVDLDSLVRGLNSQKLPAILSRDAGCFVCNSTYYAALDAVLRAELKTLAAFVHLPNAAEHLTDQQKAQRHHWPLAGLTRAAELLAMWLADFAFLQSPPPPSV